MSEHLRRSQQRFALLNSDDCSGERNEYGTPQDLFDRLHAEFRFTLDACATAANTKCKRFYSRADDGLTQSWGGFDARVWCNPPYGREIKDWLAKAETESFEGAIVVCLIPSRTDTDYWHRYVMHADEIRFIKGRIKFGGMKNNAPFSSALVVFRDHGWRRWPLSSSYEAWT